MPTFVTEDYMLDWHKCQICYPLEIKLLLVLLSLRKKEIFPFSLFEMHGGRSIVYSAFVVAWPHKHNGICFYIQRRLRANKEKGDGFVFQFSLFDMHGGRSMVYIAFVVFWPYKHNSI